MHERRIVDQFSRQAEAFAEKHARERDVLAMTLEQVGVTSGDTVLDVACGPGVLACAFATVARHVTGIDITPAMLDRARRLQSERGLANVSWCAGDVERLPFDDGSFSLVVSRYAVHHFESPLRVVSEMRRVCRAGGTVVLIDSAPAPEKADAFNRLEKFRDPSHVRALTEEELVALTAEAGLSVRKTHRYEWQVEAERQIAASFPDGEDTDVHRGRERLRRMFDEDVGVDALGMSAVREGGEGSEGRTLVSYPTLLLVSRRADET